MKGSYNVEDTGLITVNEASESHDSKYKDSTAGDVEGIPTIDKVDNRSTIGESAKADEDDAVSIMNYEDSSLV